KGGNVFSFVMAMDKVEFPEAVKRVAARVGITIVERSRQPGASREEEDVRSEILRLNGWASGFYAEYLANAAAAAGARSYLAKRRLSKETIARFGLGFAPESWDTLLAEAKRHGFSEPLIQKAGLAVQSQEGKRLYDRFRGRIMFPILDTRDRTIGFGARLLEGEGPKYINSPETPVFSKGRNFYGLNLAKHKAAAEGRLAIVEGYTDVMMAHQYGFDFAVATLGTALTADHVSLARRYAQTVFLVYDGDTAGAKACERSVDILLAEDIDVRIAEMPAGHDPCDALIKFGPDAFKKAVEQAAEIFAYRLIVARKRHDLNTLDGKTRFADDMLLSILPVRNAMKRDLQIRELAEHMKVGSSDLALHAEETLRSRLQELARTARAGHARYDSTEPADQDAAPVVSRRKERLTSEEMASRELIEVMLAKPALVPEVARELSAADFHGAGPRAIAAAIFAAYERTGTVRIDELVSVLNDEQHASLAVELVGDQATAKGKFEKRMKDCVAFLERKHVLAEAAAEKGRAREAAHAGDTASLDSAMMRFQKIHGLVQSGGKQ
ncbi:MAG: DNA primase, partial [Planctomycetota bacterium]|nr:DNA primase [Planctomycetota bacterium]